MIQIWANGSREQALVHQRRQPTLHLCGVKLAAAVPGEVSAGRCCTSERMTIVDPPSSSDALTRVSAKFASPAVMLRFVNTFRVPSDESTTISKGAVRIMTKTDAIRVTNKAASFRRDLQRDTRSRWFRIG